MLQVLRASIPMGGRALTLYDGVFQASCRLKFKFMPPCSFLSLISSFQDLDKLLQYDPSS